MYAFSHGPLPLWTKQRVFSPGVDSAQRHTPHPAHHRQNKAVAELNHANLGIKTSLFTHFFLLASR